MPSEAGEAAARALVGQKWEDPDGRLGGGTWRIEHGGVTPHPLGPGPATRIEMRTAETKGPNLRLVREQLAVSFPITTDGDVAAMLRWLGKPAVAGVAGEASANWQLAAARIEALGPAVHGWRAGLCQRGKPGQIEVVLWNVGGTRAHVTGRATLTVGATSLPLPMRWPKSKPRQVPTQGECMLQLEHGSALYYPADVGGMLAANGKPALADGVHELELALRLDVAEGEAAAELRSKKLQLTVGAAASGKQSPGK
ncbi:MAG TPA: hypothetical protein VF384_13180 [Planctomycetota bacterium]